MLEELMNKLRESIDWCEDEKITIDKDTAKIILFTLEAQQKTIEVLGGKLKESWEKS